MSVMVISYNRYGHIVKYFLTKTVIFTIPKWKYNKMWEDVGHGFEIN